ncbi:MAG: SDR family NAD(P)-dependent oxidoreductase, partial [Candidatus Binataceae bacterium]
MRLAGKVALITGAGSGMGRAAATLFAREGAKVAVIDVNEGAAKETAAAITSAGGDAFAMRADVSNSEDARAMSDETVRRFGGLDINYNNAGIEGEG